MRLIRRIAAIIILRNSRLLVLHVDHLARFLPIALIMVLDEEPEIRPRIQLRHHLQSAHLGILRAQPFRQTMTDLQAQPHSRLGYVLPVLQLRL